MTMHTRLLAVALTVVGCGDEDGGAPPITPLPDAPHVFPSADFAAFNVTTANTMSTINILFTNGGQQDLTFSELRVEPAGGPFTLIEPASRTAPSREAVIVQLQFSPTARGMALGTLVAASNAVNFPQIDMPIIGPGCASPRPDAPDLLPYEDVAVVDAVRGAAFVRFINVGERSLTVTSVSIIDDGGGAFAFASGVFEPSVDDPLVLGPGQFVWSTVLYNPPASGTHTGTVRIVSDDPDSTNTDIGLSGSR